jgi:hypothetical protein
VDEKLKGIDMYKKKVLMEEKVVQTSLKDIQQPLVYR